MNILVIGNGFDLAHGLPTKYTDFLEFCKRIEGIYTYANNRRYTSYVKENLNEWMINNEIKQALEEAYNSRKVNHSKKELDGLKVHTDFKYLDELYACIKENFWIEYFMKCNMSGKENWIDFESEISEVIQSLDEDMHVAGRENFRLENNIQIISNFLLNAKYYGLPKTYKDVRDDLLNDLNRLIRAFEIYLAEYVEKIDCKLVSADIQGIMPKEDMKYSSGYNELYVSSFNYTNTYQRLYIDKTHKRIHFKKNIDYIHGKADINNTIESNNMVLGIDEYLSKKRRNKETEFIAFKKFYQRIHKQTGCEYREWMNKIIQQNKTYKEKIRQNQLDYERNRGMGNEGYQTKRNLKDLEENPPKHNLYFFGHSLDITDKDILKDLILTENMHTTIFYHNKDVMGQQIANLVKVIGQDELIKRTGGSTKTIEFKQQQDMVTI